MKRITTLGDHLVAATDVLVYKGKDINAAYFDRPVSFRREMRECGHWFIVMFEGGGQVQVPIDNDDGAVIWIEPERH